MKQSILSIILILFGTYISLAQVVVEGKVNSVSGEALPGVNIIITGTTTGTVTDIDGLFSLSIPDINVTQLTFSFIGFTAQTIDLNGKTEFNVTLEESYQDLDEVVV